MEPNLFAALLLCIAALMAATYNTLIKVSGNRLVFFAGVNAISILIGMIGIFFVPAPPAAALPYLFASCFFYNAMLIGLSKAYSITDLSVSAPIISAVKMIWIVILSLVLLSETLATEKMITIFCIIGCILWQINIRQLISQPHTYLNIAFCLVAATLSAAQTFFDIMGIRSCDNPFSYIIWETLIGLPVVVFGFARYGKKISALFKKEYRQIIASSLLDNANYGIALFAIYGLQVLYVLPVLHIGIVFSTLIGLFILHEHYKAKRLIAAFIITICVIVLHL